MEQLPTIEWCWTQFHQGTRHYKEDTAHWEARCRHCVAHRVQELAEDNELEVINGQTDVARTPKELEAAALSDVSPVCGKSERMRNHLKSTKCPHAPESVKQIAQASVQNAPGMSRQQTHACAAVSHHYHPYASPTRTRTARRQGRNSGASEPPDYTSAPLASDGLLQALPTLWSPDSPEQWQFEEDLCQVFVSCNWSRRSIANGELNLFLTKYIPHAKIPDRQTLSGWVLDALYLKVEGGMKEVMNGKLGMGQCDGWKSSARSSIVLSSVTVEIELYTMGVHDISAQRKMVDNLLELMLGDMERAESEFGITFVGFCTDDGGDARAFCVRLHAKHPNLITTPCWAHQFKINLVVGECIKLKISCLKYLDPLLAIIKWFLNHSRALGLLKEAQKLTEQFKKTNRILTLILLVISRWIYHFLATRRMLVLSPAIRTLYLNDFDNLILCAGAKRDAQDTARKILTPINTGDFWANVAQTKLILEPLAIAAKCMQLPDAGLDSVILMLGNLYRIYGSSEMPTRLKNTIRKSLESAGLPSNAIGQRSTVKIGQAAGQIGQVHFDPVKAHTD
ncbi:hypothetical protein C8F01DRAFT_1084035 [Mycena amicta]|nr:hypothetical protein C8F01DRAFT_1084035 [Mycena amicta]